MSPRRSFCVKIILFEAQGYSVYYVRIGPIRLITLNTYFFINFLEAIKGVVN